MTGSKAPTRPLSPHMQIYRWPLPMAMSILHRISGGALYVGTILLAYWLLSMALGPAAYEQAQQFFGSPLGLALLFVYTLALMQHLVGGIRHLIWISATAWNRRCARTWPARPRWQPCS